MRFAATFALVAVIAASRAAFAATDHQVYVWQRLWSPAVHAALADSRDLFGGVRVLVAQTGRDGRWLETQADPVAFAGDARERVAVIRYDGAGAPPNVVALETYLGRLLARWRTQGAPFAAIEIDYDCANSRLADYAQRLRELRAALPADLRVSLTALPSWLESHDLDRVLDAADEAVLQVHAVQRPDRGLFDAALAERWTRAFAARTRKPFRIALPAYGSRVHFDANGRATAVESEMPVDGMDSDDARELTANPREVVGLLARLAVDAPAHWRGVAWFRLPLMGDRRAWTLAALREAIAGRAAQAHFEAILRTQPNGATDIAIANRGGIVAAAPEFRIDKAECSAHDAPGDWRVQEDGAALRFIPQPGRWIAPGRERAAGWVRCTKPVVVVIDEAREGERE